MAYVRSPTGRYWPDEKSFVSQQQYVQPLPTPPLDPYQPLSSPYHQTANVAAAVAFPPSMHSGPDHMGAPPSFTARRPNASNLPQFELPPPPLAGLQQKYQPFPQFSSTQPTPTSTSLTSVGNLLTPPSNSSADGISPSSGVTSGSSISNQGAVPPFTPNGSGMWPPPPTGTTPYGFQSQSAPQPFGAGRPGLFSPSLNSIIRGNNSPTASEGLPPPPYEMPQYSQQSSMPMSAPSLPAFQSQQQQQQMIGSAMMGGQTPVSAVTQASPVNSQAAFDRPPPTPTYYNGSQPSSTPQQANFPYSTGPSPIQQSPVSAGGPMPRVSPVNGHGPVPSLHSQPSYAHYRPSTYPPMGPVLSNVNNPNGQLALVGGMSHGMPMGFNSGHAAQMHSMYPHHTQAPNPQNDRPFRCDQCPQSFNRNHDLKRHKRIHLAVKPFPCGHCDKSFSRKDALKVRSTHPTA